MRKPLPKVGDEIELWGVTFRVVASDDGKRSFSLVEAPRTKRLIEIKIQTTGGRAARQEARKKPGKLRGAA